jgi:mono/diheme cytochrome c family protein
MGGKGGAPASNAPADLYAFYCFDCHGEKGAGADLLAPETQHPVRDYSTWVVRNGLPGMGFKDPMEPIEPDVLSDAQLETIWDWLDEPPQPTTGEGLYLDYCGNCHGADGLGGPTMRPITNELGELEAITRDGAHLGEFENRREYMPAYSTMELTDAEVDLIYDYVESL